MHDIKGSNQYHGSQIGTYNRGAELLSLDEGGKFSEAGYRGEPDASSKFPGSISLDPASIIGKDDQDDDDDQFF